MGYSNKLIHEKSLYLQQHANNPVDWYPWGDEAFEKAKKENKPVFLSIGYSSCHWCHVMGKESFENSVIAKMLNDAFICVKVDREERPDIDENYMEICQRISGIGGWPLTIIMTPDKIPFFAATYIPSETKGRNNPGLKELIPSISDLWRKSSKEVLLSAKKFMVSLNADVLPVPAELPGNTSVKEAFEQLREMYDQRAAGFGTSPKFPTPHNLLFLLRYWYMYKDVQARLMVEETLIAMRNGGIYDQLGYGFHRYSTDRYWKVPHFEKMLYDQAMHLFVYSEAWNAIHEDAYKRTAEELVQFLERDLKNETGAFYTAIDADTNGKEGSYYLWDENEIYQILGNETGQLALDLFGVSGESSHELEGNVLCMPYRLRELAAARNSTEIAIVEQYKKIREKLFDARKARTQPITDKKIVADWNGLAIASLARAGRYLHNPKMVQLAKDASKDIMERLFIDKVLRHTDTSLDIIGFLDDYAFFIWGLAEIYLSTNETYFLDKALWFNSSFLEKYFDSLTGQLSRISSLHEQFIYTKEEAYDDAYFSGAAVAIQNQFILGIITGNDQLENAGRKMTKAVSRQIDNAPANCTGILLSEVFWERKYRTIVVAGENGDPMMTSMLSLLRKTYLPSSIVLINEGNIPGYMAWADSYVPVNGRTAAYICEGETCLPPIFELDKLQASIENENI